jgi:hypothetical protein
MKKEEVDEIIDSFTNSILFKHDAQGKFVKDSEGNLVRNFNVA